MQDMEKIFDGGASDIELILKQSFAAEYPGASISMSIDARVNFLSYRVHADDRKISSGNIREIEERIEHFIKGKYPDKEIKARIRAHENMVCLKVWTPKKFDFSLE